MPWLPSIKQIFEVVAMIPSRPAPALAITVFTSPALILYNRASRPTWWRGTGKQARVIIVVVTTPTQAFQSAAPSITLPTELDREALIRAFRLMYLSRSLDDREILLKRQNRIFFQ